MAKELHTETLQQAVADRKWQKAKVTLTDREIVVTDHPECSQDYYLYGLPSLQVSSVVKVRKIMGPIRKSAVVLL